MYTAYDLVLQASRRAPQRLALVDDLTPRRFTYAELIAEIDRIAAGLAARGIGAGTRVATVLNNSIEHGLVLLALQRLGAVPALLNLRLAPADIVKLAAHGGIAASMIHPIAELASALRGVLPANAMLLSVGGAVAGAERFEDCRGAPASLPPVPMPGREDPSFFFYTSGTTGLPKAVVIPHRATEHRILWLATQAGLRHGGHNRALNFMPMSHAIGFYGIFLVTLAFDGTVFCQTQFNPAESVKLIEQHGITYMFAVPTLYHAITQAPNYRPEAMKSLRLVLFGGGTMAPELFDRMTAEWPATLRHIYGTTETMCSGYNAEPTRDTLATLGPGFYTAIRVVRLGGGGGDLVAPGEDGELIVDAGADTVFSSYLNRPDATAEKVRHGWYFTGDMARLEPDGRYTLMGRVDDMIRCGGENIFPEDVEDALKSHPSVADSSAIGLPDDRWGQIVVACVVRKDGGATAASLDAHCRKSTLAPFKRPRAYFFVDGLPRNAANKVLRRILRDQAASARSGGGPAFCAAPKA